MWRLCAILDRKYPLSIPMDVKAVERWMLIEQTQFGGLLEVVTNDVSYNLLNKIVALVNFPTEVLAKAFVERIREDFAIEGEPGIWFSPG